MQMIRRALAFVALLPGFVLADVAVPPGIRNGGLSHGIPGGGSSPVNFRASFATAGCYSSPVADTGQALTATRSTSETCLVSAVLTTCTANQLCVEDSLGALIQVARTNVILQSQTMTNVAWVSTGVGSHAADGTVTDPFGATTAIKNIEATAGAGSVAHGLYQAYIFSAATYTFSVFVRDGNVGCVGLSTENTVAQAKFNLSTGTVSYDGGFSPTITAYANGWYRITITAPQTAVTQYPEFYAQRGQCTNITRNYTGDGASYFHATGAQLEVGAFASSYIPTTTTSVARSADVLSAANPLASVDTSWCLGGTYKPQGGRAWNAATTVLGSLGTQGAANTATLENNLDGKLYVYTYDGATAVKQGAYTHALAAGAASRLVGCDAVGTLSLDVGTSPVALTGSGAGTGQLVTQPATLWIGQSNSAAQFSGNVKNFAVSRSATAGRLP